MKYLFTLILISFVLGTNAQTAGTLSFTVKTVTYSAPYSPRHILAIWVANSSGTWVKTRKLMSKTSGIGCFIQYLTNFKNATGSTYNTTDATTGATLQAHTTHTVTWDGKNNSGTLVADGTYRVYIEFTSANTTGKIYYCEFTKGPTAQTVTPANQTNFQNISLTWTPSSSSVDESINVNNSINCFPNPFTQDLNISINNESGKSASVGIFDISGKLVRSISNISAGESNIIWNGKNNNGTELPSGIYLVSYKDGLNSRVVKVIKK